MNSYKIIVLGTSGAGKTVFLASLFSKLAVQRKRTGFFLSLPQAQKNTLVNVYNMLNDAQNQAWPKGTRSESRWDFTCMVQTAGKAYRAFQFLYFDYAGTLLTDNFREDSEGFSIELQAMEADAILVLLDGQKVLNSLQGKQPSTIQSLNYDLSHLLPLVQKLQDKVVHFVITKWDLLESYYASEYEHDTASLADSITIREQNRIKINPFSYDNVREKSLLGLVREHLLRYEDFADIVGQRKSAAIPTRLIPVSAVGKDFARLEETGQSQMVTKLPLAKPNPVNVEIPLAYTIPDGFEVAHERLKKSASFKFRLFLFNLVRILGFAGEFAAMLVGVLPPQYRLGTAVVSGLILFAGRNVDMTKLQEQQQWIRNSIQNEKDAIDSAIANHKVLIHRFEAMYPESNLHLY